MTEEEFKKKAKTIPTNIETEEKIALDYFKYKVLPTTNGTAFESKEGHYTKVLLNLIEKLQKENEDYEKDNNYLRKREEYLEKRREEICKIVSTQTTEFSVPKEKIREKIKVLEIQAEEFKNLFKSSYAMKDEYLYAKVKIQGYKELLEEE